MKKELIFALAIGMMLTACQKPVIDLTDNGDESSEPTSVTLKFSPYEVSSMGADIAHANSITRSASAISEFATRLDVWIYYGGTEVTAVHQNKDDEGFGSITAILDKTKTYTLYAVAHRCTSAASLSNGVVMFPDEKVTHSFFFTQSFSPATTTSLSCLMERIVGMFRLETSDAVPEEVKTIEFELGTTPTRWNVAGYGENPTERTVTFSNISRKPLDGTSAFSIYIISDPDEASDYNIVATAYDEDSQVIQTRTFNDVPIRNGYKTTYIGTFFTDTPMDMTFTANDWIEYDVVNF